MYGVRASPTTLANVAKQTHQLSSNLDSKKMFIPLLRNQFMNVKVFDMYVRTYLLSNITFPSHLF